MSAHTRKEGHMQWCKCVYKFLARPVGPSKALYTSKQQAYATIVF